MNDTQSEKINVAAELLDHNVEKRPEKTAIIWRDEKISFRELKENCCRYANTLDELGIKPVERVLLVLPDRPTFHYAFLGSVLRGAIPIPVNAMLKRADYEYMLENSRASAVITTPNHPAAEARSEWLKQTFVTGPEFDRMMDEASTEFEPVMKEPDDIAFGLYSSGSTGNPKGVPHRSGDLLHTADSYCRRVIGLGENDVVFSASKLFFAYGLGNGLSFPLRFGATAVLLSDPPAPETVLGIVAEHRPTVFFGVPTLYNSLLKRMDGADLSSIRICLSAGEALPPEIFNRWKDETGLEILDGIGSTEALHIFISNMPGRVRPGTSGELVPGYEARIVDDEGEDLPDGEAGQLLLRGESLTKSYWKRPDANESQFIDGGWFRTGDMYMRRDGYYHYQGRGDDMLKVGGIWVSPIEIENALIEHPAVGECAVVGKKIEGLVKPFAFAVPAPGVEPGGDTEKEIIADLKSRLPKYKVPWRIFFREDLPKTVTGKVQRYKLRAE